MNAINDKPAKAKKLPRKKYHIYDEQEQIRLCELFAQWGGSKTAFCAKHDVTCKSLNQWLRRLEMLHLEGRKGHPAIEGRDLERPSVPAPETEPTHALELHIRGSLDLYFTELPDPLWLARFLSELKGGDA